MSQPKSEVRPRRHRADERGARRTILVVDDSAEDRAAIRRMVRGRRPHYVVREAATGEEGLRLCREGALDCVLLDFFLSDMDGAEWLGRVATGDGALPPVPVVTLTGLDEDDLGALVLDAGAEDFIVKDSLTGLGLVRAIENAIEKCRIRRQLVEQRARVELRNRTLELLRDELQARVAELAAATHAKDRFLAVMSHEMRTPLNAILGYADLLDLELDGRLVDGQRGHVGRIRSASRHLLDLINDLLDITMMEADRLVLDLQPIDVGAVVEEAIALLEVQAAAKGLRLIALCGAPDMRPALADLQRLRQVLLNLVGNAIKFTERGSVVVHCAPLHAEERVRLSVTDTGIGIGADDLPRIFSEFYQVDGALTRRRDGSGLGLAIAKRLVERMGGSLDVESALGAGSTFSLTLPAARGGGVRRLDGSVGRAGHTARPPRALLLVDRPRRGA